jgi:hypothetical protein
MLPGVRAHARSSLTQGHFRRHARHLAAARAIETDVSNLREPFASGSPDVSPTSLAMRIPLDTVHPRDRRISAPRQSAAPGSLTPLEVAIRPPNRVNAVFGFLAFVVGFTVALACVELLHRASLTAMRDAAVLRDPSRP